MSDRWIESLQRGTARTLGDRYAAGELSTSTFETRLDLALRVKSGRGASMLLWDLAHPLPWLRVDALDTPAGVLEADEPRATWIVGRSSACDLRLGERWVSARHARIAKRGPVWTIEDLGSTNGTWIKGTPVDTAVLAPGDVIDIGTCETQLRVEGRPRHLWRVGRPAPG